MTAPSSFDAHNAHDAHIQSFEAAYQSLLQFTDSLSEELQTKSGACGEWSVCEVLAHLCGWIAEAKRRYRRYPRGTSDIHYNRDNFNTLSVGLRKDKSCDEIAGELRTLVQELSLMARAVPQHQYEREPRYAGWLVSLRREAHAHGAEIREFVALQS